MSDEPPASQHPEIRLACGAEYRQQGRIVIDLPTEAYNHKNPTEPAADRHAADPLLFAIDSANVGLTARALRLRDGVRLR
jgi:hypothetical protein